MINQKLRVAVAVILAAASVPLNSFALLYAGWNASHIIVNDAVNEAPHDVVGPTPIIDSMDITSLYYTLDSGYHYFRMDLAAAPDAVDHAPVYGILIDNAVGGGSHNHGGADPTSTRYIADPLTGIDQLLDAHWDALAPDITAVHRHNFTGNPPNLSGIDTMNLEYMNGVLQGAPGPLVGSASERNGATVEWRILATDLNSLAGATVYGATYDVSTLGHYTVDYTPGGPILNDDPAVPEPQSLLLMGVLGGLVVCFRKRLGLAF